MSTISATFPDDVLKIGQKVYIPRPIVSQVLEDEIVGYECNLQLVEQDWVIIPTSYILNTANNENITPGWKRDQFCLSRDEAQSKCKIYYFSDLTYQQWLDAIGLDVLTHENNLKFNESCELADCCEVTSSIRSILYDAACEGQMTAMQRDTLERLISNHEPPARQDTLALILNQLELVWKKTNEKSCN